MWGITIRGSRLADLRHAGRTCTVGLTRVSLRGPVEHTIVEVEGELDFTCADEVRELVESLRCNVAALDLSQLEFVDSRGVAVLTELSEQLAAHGGHDTVPITGVPDRIERTFELVRRHTRASA